VLSPAVNLYLPDPEDFLELLLLVWRSGYDDHPIQQVDRDPVGRLVVRSSNSRDASVGRHYHHRRHLVFQRSVQEREALDIQHMDLQHIIITQDDRITLLEHHRGNEGSAYQTEQPTSSHLCVYILSQLFFLLVIFLE